MEALQEYFPGNVHTWQYANTLIIEYDQLRPDYQYGLEGWAGNIEILISKVRGSV